MGFKKQKICGFSIDSYKSAIAEHAAVNNHVIKWDGAKIIDQEADKTTRWLKEAIWIRSRGHKTMNKDEGAYKLDKVFDQLITTGRQPTSKSTGSDVSRQDTKQLAE